MRRFLIAVSSLALVFVAVTAAQEVGGNPANRKLKNPHPTTPESIATGKAAFTKRLCHTCHGPDARGAAKTAPKYLTEPPSDLTDSKWDRGSTDGELFGVIRHGAGPKFEMKPIKAMTDDEIWHIINFLRSLGPPAKK
jgi:mono/diheme cytochrome c family protein